MDININIDGTAVTVQNGATILHAARKAGARIPTLCHDDGLHPYGACRVCMIEIEGPPRRMLPACTTPAAAGMSVITRSAALSEARKSMLELLLINHPLDCPVCDKAGECTLQDLVHEYGLGPSEFAEEKRTAPVDYASPLIERNQNRCILCGKCVRVCAERSGVRALTFSRRGGSSRISTAFDKPMDCDFCGACLEICPVGALTAKPSKHKSRPWNVEKTETACLYCGAGCKVSVDARRNDIIRVRAAEGAHLCAKGRFGWDAVQQEGRLMSPLIRMNGSLTECTWDEAFSLIATSLGRIIQRDNADHVGGLGSSRTMNEDNYLFQKFMRSVVGTNNVDVLTRTKIPSGLNTVYFSGDYARMGEHDVILMFGSDAGDINPLLGVEIVKAVNRTGSKLILASATQSKFTKFTAVAVPYAVEEAIARLVAGFGSTSRTVNKLLQHAIDLLTSANRVALVLPSALSPDMRLQIGRLAEHLKSVTYYPVVMRGNIQGALDMGVLPEFLPGYRAVEPERRGMHAADMLQGIERGKISALYVMGDDPVGSDPACSVALRRLEFLVVQDLYLTDTAKLAHVVLPVSSFLERSGTITTIERRFRQINKAIDPVTGSRPDWEIIQALANHMGAGMQYSSVRDITKEIRASVPMYATLNPGSRWSAELSPIRNSLIDLSLAQEALPLRHTLTAGRLLFSSGMTTTRSRELNNLTTAIESKGSSEHRVQSTK
jgi:NADH-quinone oxidoreductase chain G